MRIISVISSTELREAESGPSKAGSGPGEKRFFEPSNKGGLAKNIYTKSVRLSMAECLRLGLKGFISTCYK